jgi:hypothetical protein
MPPARPPQAQDQAQSPRPPTGPDGFKVESWVENDAQKYFSKGDLETWPGAVHDFALKVKSEFDDYRDSRLISLDWSITEVWDYVEERLEAIVENQVELSRYDEDNLEIAFIEEYFLENLEGLAIDENGLYFLMYLVDKPENGQWIKTSLLANGPDRSYYQEGQVSGYPPRDHNSNDLRRFEAAREAWKPEQE